MVLHVPGLRLMSNVEGLRKCLISYLFIPDIDWPCYVVQAQESPLKTSSNSNLSPGDQLKLGQLKNVLTAFAHQNTAVGYCQGLNFVTGQFHDHTVGQNLSKVRLNLDNISHSHNFRHCCRPSMTVRH
jgi:hypothetical protein